MKKHLFLLSSVFALLSLQAQEATMMIAANTNVKVKSGTTLYVGGEMKVANYTNANKVSNEGNIKITGKLTNLNKDAKNNDDGSNFVNEIASVGKYGQLIINKGGANNDGRISSQVKFNGNSNVLDISIPYQNITAGHFVEEAFNNSNVNSAFIGYVAGRNNSHPVYDADRYKNPLFYWDNLTYSAIQLNASGDGLTKPERAYSLSSFSDYLGGFYDSSAEIRSLSGTPVKEDIPVQVSSYRIENNYASNNFGEAYGSYIVDFTESIPLGWGDYTATGEGIKNSNYGANVFYFGNPYTSNIDLSKGEGFWGAGSNVAAIYQTTSYDYNVGGEAISSTFQIGGVYEAMTSIGAGDNSLLYVRPFQTFGIKLDLASGTNHNFVFKDEMKTFTLPNNNVINNLYKKNRNSDAPIIKQVGIDLYNSDGEFTGVKTYVVASDVYEASQMGKGVEVYNIAMEDKHTGIYTLQENEEGTVNESLINNRTYINGINESKYIAKPIHLVFQNGKGQYTFKARLNQDLKNNKNSFYFEDKKDGKIIKIDENFSYTFNVDGTDKDRFVLYWAALPTQEITKEIVEESVDTTTVVFKDQDLYKIRFDKEMGTADVFVYSISGQLINVDKKVNTSNDYIVPIVGNAAVYIVKIVGDNGKIVTKKIIK